MRSAVVVAGGYSTRFGDREKATAELDGQPLIRRVVERIDPAVDEVVINCRDEQRAAIEPALDGIDHRIALDPIPDRGPVAGIRTGCRVARGRFVFVTACDMPFVRAELATALFAAAETDGSDGAVPRIDGRVQPLTAVYRTIRAIEAADVTLDRGAGAVRQMLDHLSVTTVPDPAPERTVEDVDTPDDLRSARSGST